MKRIVTNILSLLFAITLSAQNSDRQKLTSIFKEAEQCYLIDDYQQLESYIKQYADVFNAHPKSLGDSIDVYRAYYAKMCGAYYYGLTGIDSCDYYSEQMYRTSLDIFNQRNSVTNAMVLHEELAQLYYKMRAYDKAKTELDTVYQYYDERVNIMGISSYEPQYYKSLSQLAMCNARLGDFGLALDQIDEAIHYYKRQEYDDYYEALRKRGKILMLQADSTGSTNYKEAINSYKRYINERYDAIARELGSMNDSQRNQYWLSTHQFLYDCFRLGNRAPEMLYDLTLFSKDYLVRKDADMTKWRQVRQALRKQDCAIEFVQYFGRNDEKRLGCMVLRNNSPKPLFIDLFATDSLLNLPLTDIHTIGSAIAFSISEIKDSLYNDRRLPALIWSEPLMKAIGNAQRVYFSPDGLLHQLAIEYLMPDTTKICCRLSSTRVLTRRKAAPKMSSALLCGGIEYNSVVHPADRNNDVVAYRFLAPQTTTINDLSWTRKEVDSILALRNNPNDTLLVGRDATDKAFLQLLKHNYDVIHISTHGYFGGRTGIHNDIKPLLNDDSMSQSGLLFAGVANTLTDKDFDENLFDGVLSAAELSKQDLSHSELIVLSACQTGLGHLTADGVHGIQRGLKQAGANAMMLSLWNVNDYSASVLMRHFYKELESQTNKDIHSAFLKARKKLEQEEVVIYWFDVSDFTMKTEVIKYDKPQHINPFIIIDAI